MENALTLLFQVQVIRLGQLLSLKILHPTEIYRLATIAKKAPARVDQPL